MKDSFLKKSKGVINYRAPNRGSCNECHPISKKVLISNSK